jgi:hypothetical protein
VLHDIGKAPKAMIRRIEGISGDGGRRMPGIVSELGEQATDVSALEDGIWGTALTT